MPMEGAGMGPPLLVRGAAAAALTAAVTTDLVSGEHPTHTTVIIIVAALTAMLRRQLGRTAAQALPTVWSAIAAQPALHLPSKVKQPEAFAHDHGNLLHVLVSDAPAASVQVVAPALVLIVVAAGAHLAYLLFNAECSPLAWTPAPIIVSHWIPVTIRASRLGSILRWCGWVVSAARRGPPRTTGHVAA